MYIYIYIYIYIFQLLSKIKNTLSRTITREITASGKDTDNQKCDTIIVRRHGEREKKPNSKKI